MIYKQLSYLPIIFQVDEDILNNIPEFLQRNKLNFQNVLVVSGIAYSKRFAAELAIANQWELYVVMGNSVDDVESLKRYSDTQRVDLIIAIGGGKVLDTVKRVSYLTNINHLSVPTIISNDGLISPIAVVRNASGKTESIPGMMPMGVVIDLDIIKNSPLNYIRAAAGDILSNLSATNDWILAYKQGRDDLNDLAFHLSKSAANSLLYFNEIDLSSKQFLRMVVQGQVNSGIAMSLAGTSRPCSGSEHLISHALDFLELTEGALHGTQVASISIFTLFLQGKLQQVHVDYAQATGIPLSFMSMMTNSSSTILGEVYERSKQMRRNRFTVLDTLTKHEFLSKVEEFSTLSFIS